MFFLGAAILIATNSFFIFFGTDQEQPWNNPEPNQEEEEDNNGHGNEGLETDQGPGMQEISAQNHNTSAAYDNEAMANDNNEIYITRL